jgi:hypothetical protein
MRLRDGPVGIRGMLARSAQWLRSRSRSRPVTGELAQRKAQLEATFGPWMAHNCELAPGLWTIRPGSVNSDEKTRRCLRIAQDFVGSDFSWLPVLDIGAGGSRGHASTTRLRSGSASHP